MDGIAMFQAFQATGQPIITTLIKPNFLTNKWDGDLRLAFQFIPFAQNLLDQAGLSYILDLNATPYLYDPTTVMTWWQWTHVIVLNKHKPTTTITSHGRTNYVPMKLHVSRSNSNMA